ncbi:MAG: hypothetical protein R3B70_06795 [Polyangiaceae bacterium]
MTPPRREPTPRPRPLGPTALLLAATGALSCQCAPAAPPPEQPLSATSPAAASSTSAAPSASQTASPPSAPPVIPIPAPAIEGPPLDAVTWSPKGRWLAAYCMISCAATAASPDGVPVPLQLLDAMSGALHRSLLIAQRATGGGSFVAFSPDESALATAHQSGVERVFRTADGKLLRELTLSAVYEAVAFAPDSSRVIFGSVLGDTALVGLPRGDLVHRHIEKNPFATAVPITFTWSAQSDRLLVTRSDTTLVSPATGASLATLASPSSAEDTLLAFTPDGASLLRARCDGSIERLRPDSLTITEVLQKPASDTSCALALTPAGDRLLRATNAGLEIFDLTSRTSRLVPSPGLPNGPLLISADGTRALQLRFPDSGPTPHTADPVALVHVFDLFSTPTGTASPTASAAVPAPAPAPAIAPALIIGEGTPLGFAPNGDIYRFTDAGLTAWSPVEKTDTFRAAFDSPVRAAALSSDGRFIAVTDGQLVLFRTSDRAHLRVSIAPEGAAPRLTPPPADLASFLR